MKILRFALVLIAYAGWLAWPFLSPFFEGAPLDVAAQRTGAMIEAGGGIAQSRRRDQIEAAINGHGPGLAQAGAARNSGRGGVRGASGKAHSDTARALLRRP